MYSRGMSTRDISATIDDIYGFKLSAEQISKITDCILEKQQNWQNRPWIQDTESKHFWMQIFDEIKARGVQEVGFMCMDGVSGLEDGAKAIAIL